MSPRDIKVLCWCSAGPEENALWVKSFTFTSFVAHLFLLGLLKVNLALLLDQLRLA